MLTMQALSLLALLMCLVISQGYILPRSAHQNRVGSSCAGATRHFNRQSFQRQYEATSSVPLGGSVLRMLNGVGEDDGEDDDDADQQHNTDDMPAVDLSVIDDAYVTRSSDNSSDVRVGIIMAKNHHDIVQNLYLSVNQSLASMGIYSSNIFATHVPSVFELPVTARLLAASKRVDVIISLGCLVKETTPEFDVLAGAVAHGLMQVSLDTMVPCINGILVAKTARKALALSSGTGSRGLQWGLDAVEMGLHRLAALGLDGKASRAASAAEKAPLVTFRTASAPASAPVIAKPISSNPDGGTPARRIGF